jgi:hypothetical protein
MLSAMPRPFNPCEKATVPTHRRFVGNRVDLDGFWRNENTFQTMGIENITVQHVARLFITVTM